MANYVFRFLASGDSMISISYAFRIAPNIVSKIINETCSAIWDSLSENVLVTPNQSTWLEIAEEFEEKWQLPQCVGATDGKHVVIQVGKNVYNFFFNLSKIV